MTFNEFKRLYENTWNESTEANPNLEFTINLDKFNIGSTDKVLSDSALYAVWYFITNDFTGGIIRNNTSKTEYKITKNGVTDTFTLTTTNQRPDKCDIKKYMELFNKSFNMKCELEQLKAQLIN